MQSNARSKSSSKCRVVLNCRGNLLTGAAKAYVRELFRSVSVIRFDSSGFQLLTLASASPAIVDLVPPTDCGTPGSWAAITLNLTVTSNGTQFDRLGIFTFKNVECEWQYVY